MIPKTRINPNFDIVPLETNTYKLQNNKKDITGYTDDKEAMAQSIYLQLQTERYKHLVYSWNYGIELSDLFGRPTREVMPLLPFRVDDCLLNGTDDRILDVTDYVLDYDFRNVYMSFTVHTIFGNIDIDGRFIENEGVYRFESIREE